MAVKFNHIKALAVHNLGAVQVAIRTTIVVLVATRITMTVTGQVVTQVAIPPYKSVVVEQVLPVEVVVVVTYLLLLVDRSSKVHDPFYSPKCSVEVLSIYHSTRYRIDCTIQACSEGYFERSVLH